MEDVYTIKVKTKPDTRNLYPSERRYSASTVSGLAWVHIALAATSFLLACLALVNPNSDVKLVETKLNNNSEVVSNLTHNDTDYINSASISDAAMNIDRNDNANSDLKRLEQKLINNSEVIFNFIHYNATEMTDFTNSSRDEAKSADSNYILVLAPSLLTIFALAAGVASIMASVKWYIDRNITWLFIMSVLSTIVALTSFVMIAAWFVTTSEDDITEFYKDTDDFKNYFIVKHADVVMKNESHIVIKNSPKADSGESRVFTKRVLSINILIAAFLELLWSILSVKISYKGMRNNYKDNETERRGNCVSVVTTIKGNTKKLPRNGKLLPPKPDLINHYPSTKIQRIFLAQSDNGFYLKNQNNKAKNTETSSEFYKERMMSFLNRCASLEGANSEMNTPSIVQTESVLNLNTIPEATQVEINLQTNPDPMTPEIRDRMTPISWGDSPDHTVYNQNTLNLEKIFIYAGKNEEEIKTEDTV